MIEHATRCIPRGGLAQLRAAAGCALVERIPAMADRSASNYAETGCILEIPRTTTVCLRL